MPYVDPSEVRLERQDSVLTVRTPFWTVTHDLKKGGAPVDLRFVHGQEGNVLREPIATRVAPLLAREGLGGVETRSDLASPDTTVEVRRDERGLELLFCGSMGDESGRERTPCRSFALDVKFQTLYRYTPYRITREVRLRRPAGLHASLVLPLSAVFDGRFDHWSPQLVRMEGGPLGHLTRYEIAEIPPEPGVFYENPTASGWVSLLRLGGEGIQILPCGDLTAWDGPAGVQGTGKVCLIRRLEAIEVRCEVLAVDDPLPAAGSLPGEASLPAAGSLPGEASLPAAGSLPAALVFRAILTLVNLPEVRPAPLRSVMVGNPPFPAENLLRAWADSGVELIVLMEGAAWANTPAEGTDRFWPVNTYPGYRDEADRRDLDRLVHSAHQFGLKVLPYTCPVELHPESPVFAAHIREWQIASRPNGHVRYHYAGKMPEGIYGAWVCPESPSWREFYLNHVRTLLTHHDFDGVYIDNVEPGDCHNARHGLAHHSRLDGQFDLLEAVRDLLGPDQLMVIHNGDQSYLAMTNNVADMVVTFESQSWYQTFRNDLGRITCVALAFPACRVAMVPVSTWYNVPAPQPPQTGLRDGLAKAVLVGTIPYSYAMWEPRWGYASPEEAIRDPRGIYAAFRTLKLLHLDGLHFDSHAAGAVRTNREGVLGARYHGGGRQVVVLANVSGQEVTDIHWECGREGEAFAEPVSGTIPSLWAEEFVFIKEQTL